jgi:hypothetical protein
MVLSLLYLLNTINTQYLYTIGGSEHKEQHDCNIKDDSYWYKKNKDDTGGKMNITNILNATMKEKDINDLYEEIVKKNDRNTILLIEQYKKVLPMMLRKYSKSMDNSLFKWINEILSNKSFTKEIEGNDLVCIINCTRTILYSFLESVNWIININLLQLIGATSFILTYKYMYGHDSDFNFESYVIGIIREIFPTITSADVESLEIILLSKIKYLPCNNVRTVNVIKNSSKNKINNILYNNFKINISKLKRLLDNVKDTKLYFNIDTYFNEMDLFIHILLENSIISKDIIYNNFQSIINNSNFDQFNRRFNIKQYIDTLINKYNLTPRFPKFHPIRSNRPRSFAETSSWKSGMQSMGDVTGVGENIVEVGDVEVEVGDDEGQFRNRPEYENKQSDNEPESD